MKCRNCNNITSHVFADLGASPPSNSFISKENLDAAEVYFPLKVFTCDKCFLTQVDEYKNAEEIFSSEYVYFSSFSKSWLKHAKSYCEKVTSRFELNKDSFVVEIASNDGYLLKNFVEAGVPCLGVEPTKSTATKAKEIGVNTVERFFGVEYANEMAQEHGKADLIIGNNVLAHVPNIHDFVGGFKHALKPNGVITLEFPHLKQLVENNQFDTIYHEHFSYLSFSAVRSIFLKNELKIFDVEEIPTHGGSLRVYGCLKKSDHSETDNVKNLQEQEDKVGINTIDYYENFQNKIDKIKMNFLSFLIDSKKNGLKVAGYGAAAKGNTLLNYCGVKNDLLPFVVDASPYKQNLFLPGSRIPVTDLKYLEDFNPDVIIIFPWNIKNEIMNQLKDSFSNAKFATFIPKFEISN